MDTIYNSFHPFEVTILQGLENPESLNFAVNIGKVFNFYNPLNYRKVKYDATGVLLPNLPYSLVPSTESPDNTSFEFSFEEQQAYKINIYLLCSFNPPSGWVSGPSYIPMIDNAWIICKYFFDEQDSSLFAIKGQTKNQSDTNIKFESFDYNLENYQGEEPNLAFYEEEINPRGNAVNLGIIASLNKQEDDTWKISQFLKENYPVMDFFNSNDFEFNNTTLFDQNVSIPKDDFKYQLNTERRKIVGLINAQNIDSERGYIKYTKELSFNNYYQFKFPDTNSPAEYLSSYSYNGNFYSDPRFTSLRL
jgi:hypothetical protein